LDLSVVVPSYGNRGHIDDVVNYLLAQSPAVREVIISHSGEVPPGITKTNDRLTLLRSEDPLLAGAARNRGAAQAKGTWLAFIDDDVVVAHDWSENLAKSIHGKAPFALVGSIDVDRAGGFHGGYWGTCLWYVEFGSMHSYMPARPVEGGASANMAVHRDVFEAACGFPENCQQSEDTEFLARCRCKGFATDFHPEIRVSHRNISGFAHAFRHIRNIGNGSARIRKITKLRGNFAVRYPWLAPLMVPGRLGLMSLRVLRFGSGGRRMHYLTHLPGIAVLLVYWCAGFVGAAMKDNAK
jgi:GT2 family glycosyltransferase